MSSDHQMQKLFSLIIACVFLAHVVTDGVHGATMVSGTVFCDQCKDGQVSVFDYPLSGMNVNMLCPGSDGQLTVVGKDTTNMLGGYGMSFDGTPDLSQCHAQLSDTLMGQGPPRSNNSCAAAIGPPKSVRLMFNMFDMAMYTVDPLISQPAQPMSYCASRSSPPSTPVTQPPPVASQSPPVAPVTPVTPSAPPRTPAPVFRLPPMPGVPPLPPMPPAPFQEDTACPTQYWMMPKYKCYWRAVNPEMTVALVFGPVAARKYGTEMTLWKGLQGRGDPYRTLLREGVTAMLNSYNTFRFPYNAFEVFTHFNAALMGSDRTVLLTALRFKRANSGHGHIPCKFTSCH